MVSETRTKPKQLPRTVTSFSKKSWRRPWMSLHRKRERPNEKHVSRNCSKDFHTTPRGPIRLRLSPLIRTNCEWRVCLAFALARHPSNTLPAGVWKFCPSCLVRITRTGWNPLGNTWKDPFKSPQGHHWFAWQPCEPGPWRFSFAPTAMGTRRKNSWTFVRVWPKKPSATNPHPWHCEQQRWTRGRCWHLPLKTSFWQDRMRHKLVGDSSCLTC
mmetsp:Transcript_17921/g.38963  ORF Transcript_17921/g.38963 Transcript_17921/m.38963 type:complete len:214 (-) Transcript_17921:2079-2720(-)